MIDRIASSRVRRTAEDAAIISRVVKQSSGNLQAFGERGLSHASEWRRQEPQGASGARPLNETRKPQRLTVPPCHAVGTAPPRIIDLGSSPIDASGGGCSMLSSSIPMLALFFCMAARIDKPQHAIRRSSVWSTHEQWEASGQCKD